MIVDLLITASMQIIDLTGDTMSQASCRESDRLWTTSTRSSLLLNVVSMAMLNIGCAYQSGGKEHME